MFFLGFEQEEVMSAKSLMIANRKAKKRLARREFLGTGAAFPAGAMGNTVGMLPLFNTVSGAARFRGMNMGLVRWSRKR